MLANNNRAILRRLARNELRREWKRTAVLFMAIVVATVLLFGVLTTGVSYLSLARLQDTRLYGGEDDISVANGFTDEQYQQLVTDARVESVGQQAYAGFVQSTEADDTVSVGLVWDDEVLWNVQRAAVITAQEGRYPEAANEVMAHRDALAACGLASLGVGDHFTATVETNAGVQTLDFVISGLWEGYGDTSPLYVSRAFLARSGYALEESGILSIKLVRDYVLPTTIDDIEAGLALSGQQVFQSSSYIDQSWKILLGLIGLSAVIVLSAYLLVYNILYISAAKKSRYYGLLQILGMTPLQVAQLVRRQMLGLAFVAVLFGTVLGALSSLVLVPRLMNALGITETLITVHFHPLVLVLTLVAVSAAVFAGLRTPLRMARKGTPLDALKARPQTAHRAALGRGRCLSWRLALAELGRDRRKTAIVLVSLALSLSVFLCLTTLISSQSERTVAPLYDNADLLIRNDSETSEDMHSWQPILEGLAEEIAAVDGVAAVETVTGVPFKLADEAFAEDWLTAYSATRPYLDQAEVLSAFQGDPSRYYGMLKGIDAQAFDALNAQLSTPLERDAFLRGEVCVLAYSGIEVPEERLNAPLAIRVGDETINVWPATVSNEGYYAASKNIGPTLIVSKDWLDTLEATPLTLSMLVRYDTPYDAITEERVMALVNARPGLADIYNESLLANQVAIQATEGDLNETGAAIALLLLVVGMLNYVNTMAASIQSRRLSLSIMESLGMTPRQIHRQLVCEGLLIAFGVLILTASFGLGLTFLSFQAMNHMDVPFVVPLLPVLGATLLMVLLCACVPLVCYHRLGDGDTLIERLRMSE